jgi:GR25 family glycosyltransferase involved in LPS biosynthesis
MGLSPLFWVNLDASVDRRERMQSQLRAYGIEGRRIAAVDGRQSEAVAKALCGKPPPHKYNPAELGCTLSHLIAIDAFVHDCGSEYAIVCEDDVDFGMASYWPFRFSDVLAALPSDWECLQMAVSTADDYINGSLHRREPTECSACAYAIRRPYAERLIQRLACEGKYDLGKLPMDHRYAHCIDVFLYREGVTYCIPLLGYDHNLKSTIQVEPILIDIGTRSSTVLRSWWETDGAHKTAAELLSLDG